MSEAQVTDPGVVDSTPVESPPPAAQPAMQNVFDPRARLYQLAQELMRRPHRRALAEFLQLRRAVR